MRSELGPVETFRMKTNASQGSTWSLDALRPTSSASSPPIRIQSEAEETVPEFVLTVP